MNNSNYKANNYFRPEITPILKGLAIIFMLTLHLLKPEWMSYPELVIGFPVKDSYLYAILSNGGDICIGIFAFITGYGWAFSFDKISRLRRMGGVFETYWFILLAFAFPARLFFQRLIGDMSIELDFWKVLISLLAINSESVRFQWYIYFYALAVLTFKPLVTIGDKLKINAVLKTYLTCILFLMARFGLRLVFTRFIPSSLMLGIVSHYCQWMPVVISGYIIGKDNIFDRIYSYVSERIARKWFSCLCFLLVALLYIGKCFIQFLTGVYSNFDSFIMVPFMFCICGIGNYIDQKSLKVKKLLSFLGGISMYLWLTHNIMLYPHMQWVLLHFRFPLLILIVAFFIITPIGYFLSKANAFLRGIIKTREC